MLKKNLSFKWASVVCLSLSITHFSFSQKQETRAVKTFSSISISDRIIAILIPDTVSKVDLSPDGDAWVEEVHVNSDGKELRITSDGKFRTGAIFCYVHYDQPVVSIFTQNGGIIRTDSNEVFETKKLTINAKVDGFTNLHVKVDELIIEAGSGCDVYVKGWANKVKVYGTTGAKIHLEDLECNDAEANSILGSKIWLTAKNNYIAKAGSGGKIYYYAEPSGKFERNRATGGNVELIAR